MGQGQQVHDGVAVRLDGDRLQRSGDFESRNERRHSVRQEVRGQGRHDERPAGAGQRWLAGHRRRTSHVDRVGLGEGGPVLAKAKERWHRPQLLRPELHQRAEERRHPRSTSMVWRHLPGRPQVLQRLCLPGSRRQASAAEPDRLGGAGTERDEAGDWPAAVDHRRCPIGVPDPAVHPELPQLLPVQEPGRADRVEQPVLADHPGLLAPRRSVRARLSKALAPYLLSLPGGLWLLALFLVPLVTMLSLSLQTCNFGTGACVMTWHWGEFGQQLNLYHGQLLTSFYYAGAATVIDLLVSFPIAYWIAFYGGRKKNFFLLMLLVPFFVSFVIRTVVWEFILSDQGVVLGPLKHAHLLPQNFHVLATGFAVVAGLAYNYLPFTALPLYVAIERIDKRVLDAAYDLYATRRSAFSRVILPLTIPGLFAAFLLTFIPALGDYVNQTVLGGTNNTMIGTVIQNAFLTNLDYAGGSALSAILLAIALVGIFAYARLLGSRTIEEYL